MGHEPTPPPIRSRISPPVPVAAPLKGSTVVGKLWVSAFSEMTLSMFLNDEVVTRALVLREQTAPPRDLGKGYIVLVGRNDFVRVLLRGFLNHLEEAEGISLPSMTNLPPKILWRQCSELIWAKPNTSESVKLAAQLLLYTVEIFYFFGRERQTFLLVFLFNILHDADRLRLARGVNTCWSRPLYRRCSIGSWSASGPLPGNIPRCG
jgi:hypothetical protein